MGLKGKLPNFISNFLSDREINVRVNSTYSDIQEQEIGVPQGSILSVTLFSIKINSLAKVLNDNIEGSLYVDDFLICYRGKNMNNIERQLQLCLNKIEKWAMENGFKFSSLKTLGMHFYNKRGLHPDPKLKLYNSPIQKLNFQVFFLIVNLPFYPILKCLKIRALKLLIFYNLCPVPTGVRIGRLINFIQIVDSIKIGLRMHRLRFSPSIVYQVA